MAKRNQLSEKFKTVRELADKYRKELEAIPGVRGVGYGYKYRDGKWTTTPSVVVTVETKRAEADLVPKERIPNKLAGFPVDVLDTEIRLHGFVDPGKRQDPLVGGLSISNGRFSKGRGTMGAIVYKNGTNRPMGLTNHHVLCHWRLIKKSREGDPVTQPGYSKPSTRSTIGKLDTWNEKYDAAVFYLNDRRALEAKDPLNGISGGIKGVLRAEPGLKVKKTGTRTGLTFGEVKVVYIEEGCEIATIVANPTKPAPKLEISMPGDSGAVWVTDTSENLAVALHNRGERKPGEKNEWAAGVLIEQVLAALKIHF